MILIGLAIIGYVMVGGVVGGAFSYVNRVQLSDDDRAFFTGMVFIIWPFALVGFVGLYTMKGSVRMCEQVGGTIGRSRNRHRIAITTVRMMEQDMERFNHNKELAVRFDYRACKRCYGSGCSMCNGEGVERVSVR